MKILAVEFSSEHRSAALLENDRLLASVSEPGGRQTIALVEKVLGQAGWEREDVETIAVGRGPGSYTGIRGAIAFAQGWQLGRDVKLLDVSSVDCLAAQAEAREIFGAVNVVIDAQRNEFYLAHFEIKQGARREVEALRLASMAEIQKRSASGEIILGPDLAQWFPQSLNFYPEAAMLGQLASRRTDFIPGEKLEPIYLRETAFKKAPSLRILPTENG